MRKLILGISIVVLLGSICFSTVIEVPPTRQDIRSTWIGFTPLVNDFYRIVLRDKDGYIAHSFAGKESELYKIESWSIDSKGRLSIKTSPISKGAYQIIMRGDA